MTFLSLLISIALGTGSLAWGFARAGSPEVGRWVLFFGAMWFVAAWRRWRWFAYIGLTFDFLVAAFGLWLLDLPPGWMFAGAICGLLAWDLTDFQYRQRFAASDAERRALEWRHLLRVSFLAVLGFGLASVAMALKLQFSFEWATLLALVAVLGLVQMIAWFRKHR